MRKRGNFPPFLGSLEDWGNNKTYPKSNYSLFHRIDIHVTCNNRSNEAILGRKLSMNVFCINRLHALWSLLFVL